MSAGLRDAAMEHKLSEKQFRMLLLLVMRSGMRTTNKAMAKYLVVCLSTVNNYLRKFEGALWIKRYTGRAIYFNGRYSRHRTITALPAAVGLAFREIEKPGNVPATASLLSG